MGMESGEWKKGKIEFVKRGKVLVYQKQAGCMPI